MALALALAPLIQVHHISQAGGLGCQEDKHVECDMIILQMCHSTSKLYTVRATTVINAKSKSNNSHKDR